MLPAAAADHRPLALSQCRTSGFESSPGSTTGVLPPQATCARYTCGLQECACTHCPTQREQVGHFHKCLRLDLSPGSDSSCCRASPAGPEGALPNCPKNCPPASPCSPASAADTCAAAAVPPAAAAAAAAGPWGTRDAEGVSWGGVRRGSRECCWGCLCWGVWGRAPCCCCCCCCSAATIKAEPRSRGLPVFDGRPRPAVASWAQRD
jgi:hypothetical protein